jgi:hypothetical protein
VRADQVRGERVEVDADDLVVVALRVRQDLVVGPQERRVLRGEVGDLLALGRLEVASHRLVVGEQRGGRADLGTHVADGALAGGGDGLGTGAEVLDDRARAALDREDLGDLEDHVLGRAPARQRPGELDADEPGHAQVPGHADHHVHGVRAADADGDHAETAGVGGVGVGPDHHPAGEGVVLEHDLVDDAAARLPEAHAVALPGGAQEVVDLTVGLVGELEVGVRADVRLDEVVTVDGRRDRDLVLAGEHELQDGHLRRRVLHGHAVGPVVGVVHAALEPTLGRVVEVGEQHLLREGQGTPVTLPGEGEPLLELLVGATDELDGGRGCGVAGLVGHRGLLNGLERQVASVEEPSRPRGVPGPPQRGSHGRSVPTP